MNKMFQNERRELMVHQNLTFYFVKPLTLVNTVLLWTRTWVQTELRVNRPITVLVLVGKQGLF